MRAGCRLVVVCGLALAAAALTTPRTAFAQRPSDDKPGTLLIGSGIGGLFLRESFTRVERDDTAYGVSAGVFSVAYVTRIRPTESFVRSDRSVVRGYIGTGSNGLQGRGLGESAIGVRWSAGPSHGPLARIGARAWLEGDDDYYTSLLELPSVQLGYQVFIAKALLIEWTALGGVALVGRYDAGGKESQRLGESWVWGSQAALHWERLVVNAEWSRIERRHGSVDVLRSDVCGAAGWLLLCTELTRYAGRSAAPVASEHDDVVQLAFSIGLGPFTEPQTAVKR